MTGASGVAAVALTAKGVKTLTRTTRRKLKRGVRVTCRFSFGVTQTATL